MSSATADETDLKDALDVTIDLQAETKELEVSPSTNHIFTKRDVLSLIARIFDPLGLLGPVISKAKFFMQQLWLLKLEWHEKLPVPVASEWASFVQPLPVWEKLKIPRFVLSENLASIIIYGFCDASEKGFGAVTYVSVIKNNGDRYSQLLCSKSRVAPLKTLTISSWIKTPPHLLKTFAANRVAKIQELTVNFPWQHFSSENNPAHVLNKVYVSMFVCLSTEAIHLDFVSDLTSKVFIACLKRIFGRRGKSSKMFSDNGKTFVGANIELKKLHDLVKAPDEILVSYFNDEYKDWNFISPNFGGLWESCVKSFKTHLKRVAGSSNLTLEEFITLLAEIEDVLNSKPLSPLSSDFDDFET
ncbi:integrase catalytic domain-containing protein [Trichonephila clavipes]|nr:integrase catalytic domain-containing protein [Trichonephila clavipes]